MTAINRDEWLGALKDAGVIDSCDHPDAITADQFCEAFGVPETTGRRQLQRLVAANKAHRIRARRTVQGRVVHCWAYRLLA